MIETTLQYCKTHNHVRYSQSFHVLWAQSVERPCRQTILSFISFQVIFPSDVGIILSECGADRFQLWDLTPVLASSVCVNFFNSKKEILKASGKNSARSRVFRVLMPHSLLPFASLCERQTQESYITILLNGLLKEYEPCLGMIK